MKRRLKNTNMKPPSHSSYLRLQVICQIFYDADEKLHVLDELSISDLKSFIPELCSQLYIECLCHGNLLRGQSNYPVKYIQIELRHKEYVICLPPGVNLIRDSNVKNKSETNSVTEATQNGTFSFRFPFMKVYCLCLYVDILPLVVVSYCSCIVKLSKKQGLSKSD
ncbi:hypothetical protein DVH24_028414 [Malus domestica]|uniref:Uncharacterized protein n=1 Tax=Malus domestica TaxID=3750 RepID=A0A498HG01_MALDO|nr:hypothetical protein DVH24_028414 [Malus domestica]